MGFEQDKVKADEDMDTEKKEFLLDNPLCEQPDEPELFFNVRVYSRIHMANFIPFNVKGSGFEHFLDGGQFMLSYLLYNGFIDLEALNNVRR